MSINPQRSVQSSIAHENCTLLVSACSAAGHVDFRNPIGVADCPLTAQPLEVTSQFMLIIRLSVALPIVLHWSITIHYPCTMHYALSMHYPSHNAVLLLTSEALFGKATCIARFDTYNLTRFHLEVQDC